MSNNPIHQKDDGKFYFWDATETEEHGPFDTGEQAEKELNEYARYCIDDYFDLP